MTGPEAIQTALNSTQYLTGMYLADMSDEDLLVRAVPNMNHIAWQLGHLISAEKSLVKDYLPGAKFPELPAGFDAQHGKETAAVDPPKGFLTKAKYLELFNAMRQAVIEATKKLSPTDLDKPTTGPMSQWAPTVGHLLMMTSNHTLMHVGQITAVRRKLGKPVLF